MDTNTRYGKYVIQFEPLRVFEYKDIELIR